MAHICQSLFSWANVSLHSFLIPRENRDTSGRGLHSDEAAMTEMEGKVNSRTPAIRPPEESDGNIVPEKSTNKEMAISAESMEGRTPTKRNSTQKAAGRTQNRENATKCLSRVSVVTATDHVRGGRRMTRFTRESSAGK